MSREKYEDDCPGCRPAILEVGTGKRLPETHPHMQAALRVWAETTFAEREAYHRFCCLNSRDPQVLKLASGVMERIGAAMRGE